MEGNGRDEISGTIGEPDGSFQFSPGKVGLGGRGDGQNGVLQVGSRASLRTQSPTVEAWVRRANPTKASVSQVAAAIFSGGAGNYGVGMHDDGRLYFAIQAGTSVESTERITDTAWHHIVVGRSDSFVRFYIDGRLVSTLGFSAPASFETPFAIGGLGSPFVGDRYGFLGQIDEVTVYNRPLTDAEVGALFRADRFGKCIGDLVMDASAPAAVPAGSEFEVRLAVRNLDRLAADGAVVSNRIPEGVRYVGGSVDRGSLVETNGAVVWSLGNAPGNRTTAGFLRLVAPDASRIVINSSVLSSRSGDVETSNNTRAVRILSQGGCATGPDGLLAWVTGDDGSIERISGLPLGPSMATRAAGYVGQGFSFSGLSDAGLSLPRLPAYNLQDFTAEAWIRRGSSNAISQVAPFQSGTILAMDSRGPSFSITDQGALTFGRSDVSRVDTVPGLVSDTAWHHVAVTKSGTSVVFYVDGEEAGRATFTDVFTFEAPWSVGGLSPSGRNPLMGTLDEVALYNRALAPSEILLVYGLGRAGRCTEDLVLDRTGIVPERAALGDAFSYRLRVVNRGGSPATGVRVTNRFDQLVLVGATNGAGASVALTSPGLLVWDVGTLAGGGNADLTLTLLADVVSTNHVTAELVRTGDDLTLANNSAAFDVVVQPLEVYIGNAAQSVLENQGPAPVTVRLSPPSSRPVSVRFATVDGTAVAGRDYLATNGVVEFAPGITEMAVEVPILDDGLTEGAEEFRLVLTNAVGARLGGAEALIRITDNEPAPQLTITGGRVVEGNSGRSPIRFDVRISSPSANPVTAAFSTTNDTARSGSDYLATNGVVTIAPGELSTQFEVAVIGDRTVEPNEAFLAVLSSPTNATLRTASAAGVILNDDFLAGQVAGFQWTGTPTNRIPAGAPIPAVLTAVDGGGSPVADFSAAVSVAAYPTALRPSSLVISEVAWTTTDAVEFQNVTTNALDVSGWRVSLYDSTRWPLPKATVSLPAGTSVPSRGTFTLSEGPGAGAFPSLRVGQLLAWRDPNAFSAFDPIAVLVQDAAGRIVDFAAFDAAEPTLVSVPLPVAPAYWSSPAFQSSSTSVGARRTGNADTDSAADWVATTSTSLGLINSELGLPFVDSTPVPLSPALVLDFTNGVWAGTFTLDRPAGLFTLVADDGNGNVGISSSITMDVPNDLAVGLVASQPQAALGSTVEFTVSVTNSGPQTATNVVVNTTLDRSVNVPTRISFPGVRPNVNVSAPGPNGIVIRWTVGDLPPGTNRQMVFFQFVPASVLPPTRVVHESRVSSATPDANPRNDVARAEFEAATACTVTGITPMSWWTGDDGRDTATGAVAVPSGIVARLAGATRGPGRVDDGWVFSGAGEGVVVDPQPGLEWTNLDAGGTVEGWIRVDPAGGTAYVPVIGRRLGGNGWQFELIDGQPALRVFEGGAVVGVIPPTTFGRPLVDGLWHHLALMQSSTNLAGAPVAIAVDGSVIGSAVVPPFLQRGVGAPLVFGAAPGSNGWRGAMDEWAQHAGTLNTLPVVQAGGNGKCLFQLSVLDPGALPQASFDVPYTMSLTVTNAGPGAAPLARFAVDVSNATNLAVVATPGTQRQEPPPRLAFTGSWGDIPAGGTARLALAFTPTNPVASTLVVADAFSSSRRGRNSSRTVPVLVNPDSDNDGMSDVWELQFGLNRFLGSDGILDGDGDGMSNLEEFRAGLNPTNAASVLRLQAVAVSGTGLRVRFTVGGGRNWSLLRADSLAQGAVWSLVTNGFTGATEETAEVEVSGGQVAFFQVVVTGP